VRKTKLSVPEVGLIAGTRAALGAGLGLLLGDLLSREQRKAVGWTLVAVGVITTVPLVAQVIGESEREPEEPPDAEPAADSNS
jgi:uncharacterized membrane protein YfcA